MSCAIVAHRRFAELLDEDTREVIATATSSHHDFLVDSSRARVGDRGGIRGLHMSSSAEKFRGF